MAEIGTVIEGKYEILKLIGKGGMSKVYLAMDNNRGSQYDEKTRSSLSSENCRYY